MNVHGPVNNSPMPQNILGHDQFRGRVGLWQACRMVTQARSGRLKGTFAQPTNTRIQRAAHRAISENLFSLLSHILLILVMLPEIPLPWLDYQSGRDLAAAVFRSHNIEMPIYIMARRPNLLIDCFDFISEVACLDLKRFFYASNYLLHHAHSTS